MTGQKVHTELAGLDGWQGAAHAQSTEDPGLAFRELGSGMPPVYGAHYLSGGRRL